MSAPRESSEESMVTGWVSGSACRGRTDSVSPTPGVATDADPVEEHAGPSDDYRRRGPAGCRLHVLPLRGARLQPPEQHERSHQTIADDIGTVVGIDPLFTLTMASRGSPPNAG